MSDVERMDRVLAFVNSLPEGRFTIAVCMSLGGAREALRVNPHASLSILIDVLEYHAAAMGYSQGAKETV